MNYIEFFFEARQRGLLLGGVSRDEGELSNVLFVPLMTPKDPRSVYELVKLVKAYAHPAKRAKVVSELRERLGKKTDIEHPEARSVVWHHRWRLPDDVGPEDCVSLSEYLTNNGYV